MSLIYRTIKAFPLALKPHLRLMAFGKKRKKLANKTAGDRPRVRGYGFEMNGRRTEREDSIW
jgi:hypothetical protein